MSIEKRRVEFVHPYKDGAQEYVPGDTLGIEKNLANTLVEVGICKDPETGEQNELKPGQHKIQPHAVKQPINVK